MSGESDNSGGKVERGEESAHGNQGVVNNVTFNGGGSEDDNLLKKLGDYLEPILKGISRNGHIAWPNVALLSVILISVSIVFCLDRYWDHESRDKEAEAMREMAQANKESANHPNVETISGTISIDKSVGEALAQIAKSLPPSTKNEVVTLPQPQQQPQQQQSQAPQVFVVGLDGGHTSAVVPTPVAPTMPQAEPIDECPPVEATVYKAETTVNPISQVTSPLKIESVGSVQDCKSQEANLNTCNQIAKNLPADCSAIQSSLERCKEFNDRCSGALAIDNYTCAATFSNQAASPPVSCGIEDLAAPPDAYKLQISLGLEKKHHPQQPFQVDLCLRFRHGAIADPSARRFVYTFNPTDGAGYSVTKTLDGTCSLPR